METRLVRAQGKVSRDGFGEQSGDGGTTDANKHFLKSRLCMLRKRPPPRTGVRAGGQASVAADRCP